MSAPSLEQEYEEELLREYTNSGLSIQERLKELADRQAKNTAWELRNTERKQKVSDTVAVCELDITKVKKEITKVLGKLRPWIGKEEHDSYLLQVEEGKKEDKQSSAVEGDEIASDVNDKEGAATDATSTGMTADMCDVSISAKESEGWVEL